MLAAVSIEMVAGSKVSSAAVTSPCWQRPPHNMEAVRDVADRVEEQAVSKLTAGPTDMTYELFSMLVEPLMCCMAAEGFCRFVLAERVYW